MFVKRRRHEHRRHHQARGRDGGVDRPAARLVNSAGIGWAQRTVGKDGQYELGGQPRRLQEGASPINLIGTFDCCRHRRDGDEPHGARSSSASAARSSTSPRWPRSTARSARPSYSSSKGGVVGMTLPVARDLRRDRRAGQHDRPRPDRHPDLRHRRGQRGVQGEPGARTCCSRNRLGDAGGAGRRWSSSASPTATSNAEVDPRRRRHPHATQHSPDEPQWRRPRAPTNGCPGADNQQR